MFMTGNTTRMKIVLGLIAVICVYVSPIYVAGEEFEPSVAFICGKGAMHSTQKHGWVSDASTDCLEVKSDILKYCMKMYPDLDIRNIVESATYEHIRGWCPLKGRCDSTESFKVRSYRCLSGPFQSDALIVPKLCHFDHVLENSLCKDFGYWHEVASKSCRIKNMNTDNFAMLVPCDTDMFTGVEFVCCPNDGSKDIPAAAPTPAADVSPNQKLLSPDVRVIVNSKPQPASISAPSQELTEVDKYLKMKPEAYIHNEHDAFKLAKKQLNLVNQEKVAKIMKQWSEAKARVDAMKKDDPKGAEKLNKEISPRFQKEYFALQLDIDNRMIRLDSVHQQHVQSKLNSKKRKTAEQLMEALQERKTDAGEITKYLQRYLAIEEKDAHHCMQHYLKVRNQDPSASQQLLPVTLEHLSLISQRINQSFDLLSSLNDEKLEEEITDSVKKWLHKSYSSIDLMISKLKQAPSPKTQARKKVNKEVAPIEVYREQETTAKPVKDVQDGDNLYRKYAEKLADTDFIKKMKMVDNSESEHPQPPVITQAAQHRQVLVAAKPRMNHLAKGEQLAVGSNSLVGASVSQGSAQLSNVAIVAIVFGVVAAMFLISFSVFVVRKRSSVPGPSNNYLEVAADDSVSAEDRHIASMQNGYENPTYKLLERQA